MVYTEVVYTDVEREMWSIHRPVLLVLGGFGLGLGEANSDLDDDIDDKLPWLGSTFESDSRRMPDSYD